MITKEVLSPALAGLGVQNNNLARTVYEKVSKGNAISDQELAEAIPFFQKLEGDLAALGPVFQLATNEVRAINGILIRFNIERQSLRSKCWGD